MNDEKRKEIKKLKEIFGVRKEDLVDYKKYTVITKKEIENNFKKNYGINYE